MIHILIVEDNDMNREMIRRRLELNSFKTSMAEDGQQAIEMAMAVQPDIILMDMSLPVVDGWQATRQLKAEETTQKIPIIGLSAYASDADVQKGLDAGCDAYEVKPIDFDRLLESIERLTSS